MNDDHVGVLLEDIQDKLKGVAEAVAGLRGNVQAIDQRLANVETNTNLIPAIQAVVTDQSRQLGDQAARLNTLELAR